MTTAAVVDLMRNVMMTTVDSTDAASLCAGIEKGGGRVAKVSIHEGIGKSPNFTGFTLSLVLAAGWIHDTHLEARTGLAG